MMVEGPLSDWCMAACGFALSTPYCYPIRIPCLSCNTPSYTTHYSSRRTCHTAEMTAKPTLAGLKQQWLRHKLKQLLQQMLASSCKRSCLPWRQQQNRAAGTGTCIKFCSCFCQGSYSLHCSNPVTAFCSVMYSGISMRITAIS